MYLYYINGLLYVSLICFRDSRYVQRKKNLGNKKIKLNSIISLTFLEVP